MKLPRVNGLVHVLLFLLAIAVVYVRIWLPPEMGNILAAGAGALFVLNLLWLALSRNMSFVRVALFLTVIFTALVVFVVGLFVGLQVNPAIGSALWIVAAVIFVLGLIWVVRSEN